MKAAFSDYVVDKKNLIENVFLFSCLISLQLFCGTRIQIKTLLSLSVTM